MAPVDSTSNNKRIAKNTALLYIRMIFLLGISFYTTRAILQALGVVDLGIYNVVGGVVAMFSFINGSLSSASSRFITFKLGKGIKDEIHKTFNTIVTVHFLFGLILLVLAETIGLWFVLNKLVIPVERFTAAFWVYQSAVVSAVIVICSAPFNASIIAHEKMSAFAYISIYEALAKLLIVVILFTTTFDKLILYSILLLLVKSSVIFIYIRYCNKHFDESRFSLTWDKRRIKTIFSYAGWVTTGSLAYLLCTQGLNILLNLFFGPVVNAAQALATQLQGAINQFSTNFMMAVKPQITISYAQGNLQRMHTLILSSTKIGALLMLIILVPFFVEVDFLLSVWLKEVPDYTANFVRIMLCVGVVRAMMEPTMAAIHATGRIQKAEITEMICMVLLLPIAYALLKNCGLSPEWTLVLYLITEIYTQIGRVTVIYPQVGLKRRYYFTNIIIPIVLSGSTSIITCYLFQFFVSGNSVLYHIMTLSVALFSILLSSWCFGLNNSERKFVLEKISKYINKSSK